MTQIGLGKKCYVLNQAQKSITLRLIQVTYICGVISMLLYVWNKPFLGLLEIGSGGSKLCMIQSNTLH